MKVAIIGANGQLGSDLANAFGEKALPLSHAEIEVKDINSCIKALKNVDVVINCAAYVKVDDSEDHPEEAFMVNAIGARNVALVCNEKQMKNIYISTDFVFDGNMNKPYQEDDNPNPINTYGLSKYAGEILTRNLSLPKKYYIIRSSSLYGEKGARGKGGNFVDWMIEKANNNEVIKVVDDIVMSPTYTKDAAEMVKTIIEKELPYGIYHVSNQGYCSWFDFAKKIFDFLDIDAKLFPIKSDELDRKARRPKFSTLESKKLNSFGLRMRNWEDALKDYLRERSGGVK